MKRLSILLLLLLTLVLSSCMASEPAVTESYTTTQAFVSDSNLPGESTSPASAESTPQEDLVAIRFITYQQDAESGEYIQTAEDTKNILKGSALNLDVTAPDHYEIDLEKSRLSLEIAQEGDTLSVYFKCKTYEVKFTGGESDVIVTLRCGQTPTPPVLTRYGYAFKGFDQEIAPIYQNTVYTAEWELNLHTVTLYTADGSSIESEDFIEEQGYFTKTFSVFDHFTLPTPQNPAYAFITWNTAPDRSGEDVTEISQDTNHDLTLYAIYDVTLYEISFVEENGVPYPSYYLPYGKSVTAPQIPPENQIAGYGLTWYEDENGTKPYHFSTMPQKNITLYGKWEADTGTGFLAWNLDDIESETIDSRDELRAFIDYIHFYNITESVRIEVTYADRNTVLQDFADIGTIGDFRANGALSYGAGELSSYRHENVKCYLELKVSRNYRDTEATLSAEPTDETTYPYVFEKIVPRGDSYTDFYIDKLPFSLAVTTTNQLHYVVEHGYRPIPEAGSSAERIYLAAKKLLNEILPLDATDYEKVELIYLYLVQNVQYDDRAVQIALTPGALWSDYDAFFLEGVFDHQKAVCDGIAKAFSLLCSIEGIPCVEVVGNSHAWNRVKINNVWYVSDPTHGNLHIANKNFSITDFNQFLMSDQQKEKLGYASESYPLIKAETDYNYYQNKTFTYNGKTYDHVIESTNELTAFLGYIIALQGDLDGYTVDISYTVRFTSLSTSYQSAVRSLNRSGISCPYRITVIDTDTNSSYKILFTK